MSDFSLPDPPDSASFWGFTPQKETLYGSDSRPRKFLRIIDALPGDGQRMMHSYQDEPGDPDSMVVVETVSVDTFIKFATFGHTPYLEAALCGLKNSVGIEDYKELFLSQAAYRNYEQRAKTLLDVAQEKRYSLSSVFGNDSSQAVLDELRGTLMMWEMLMNTGSLSPLDCLSYATPGGSLRSLGSCASKFEELEGRCLMSNFSPLPFKIAQSDRDRLIEAFK